MGMRKEMGKVESDMDVWIMEAEIHQKGRNDDT